MARRKASIADDLVLLPWWVSASLALGAYAILPSALPAPMVNGGLVGIITFGLLAIAAISALRAWKMARVLEHQTGIESIRGLPWKQFENLLGEAYRRQGYSVAETLGGGADGGVDLVLRREGMVTLVQCKRWKGKPVPVHIVREIYGILIDRGATAAKVVATASFTSEAVAFAKDKPIELVDSDALLHLLRGVQTSGKIVSARSGDEPDHISPLCPRCGSVMKLREAKRGANLGKKFWGCSRYPTCKGTENA